MMKLPIVCALLLASSAAAQVPTYDDVVVGSVPLDAGGTMNLLTDIYLPAGATGPTPLLLWIHGGGWQSGTQNESPGAAMQLLFSGVAVATVGYRLSGQAIFPAQIHDVKGVVRYLRANAALYNLDPNRIACWGSSAGAHLAALLATSGGVLDLEGNSGGNLSESSRVMAAVDYFGPTDLLQMNLDVTTPPGSTINHDAPTSPESRLIGFDGPGEGIGVLRANIANPAPPFPALAALVALTNPITHLTSDDPPLFVSHGQQDTTVPFAQSLRLRDGALAIGLGPVFKSVAAAGHGFLGSTTDAQARAFLLHAFFGGVTPVGSPFCFGDNSGTACPCGNSSTGYVGCNSSLAIGGRLRASGEPSITADSLVLDGAQMPNSSALYFQGTSTQTEGAGVAFGDGLRCVTGTIVRLGTKVNLAGASQYPAAGDAPVSVSGGDAAGVTRYFQVWYRNPVGFCTAATFNLTNGVAVTFVP
jgi:acetyl esterase/lipase